VLCVSFFVCVCVYVCCHNREAYACECLIVSVILGLQDFERVSLFTECRALLAERRALLTECMALSIDRPFDKCKSTQNAVLF